MRESKVDSPIPNIWAVSCRVNNKNVIDLKDITNVLLSTEEYQSLINEFGKQKFESGLIGYSNWKQKVNAHPKSDFDSLKKWLSKANTSYKGHVSSVKET